MTSRPRPRALPVLCLVLALALIGAGCGSEEKGGGGSGEAKALLGKAFEKQADSGDLQLDVKAEVQGVETVKGPINLSIEGPFKSNGAKRLPTLDWDITFDGAGQKLSGGVIVTTDNAYLTFQGQSYELGKKPFAELEREARQATPPQQPSTKSLGLDPSSWIKDPELEDGESIGGQPTRRVSGPVDVPRVIDDVVGLFKSPEARKQFDRGGVDAADVPTPTEKDQKEIEDAVKKLDIEIDLDGNDVVRRFSTQTDLDLPGAGNDSKNAQVKLDLTYLLRKVGASPVITAPSNPKPFSELLNGFGLGGLGGGGLDQKPN